MSERLLTTREVAQRLGLAYSTMRDWVRAKRIEHYKLGYAVRISEHQLKEFLKKSLMKEADLRDPKW